MLETIITIVQQLGFPIAVAAACAFYVKYRDDKSDAKLEKLQSVYAEDLKAERADHKQEMTSITEAVNNNTLVMQKLLDKLAEE